MGFLYKEKRIQLKKITNLTAKEFKVSGQDVFDRDPFVLWIGLKDANENVKNDFLFVGLHLKSQQKYIHNHMAAVAKMLGDLQYKETRAEIGLPAPSSEDDIIIVGDCNDATHRKAGFKFMFDYLQGSGFTHLGPEDDTYPATRVNGSQIDHLFVANDMIGDCVDAGTFKVHQVPVSERDDYRSVFSDHFPVTVDVTAVEDDDD